MKRTPHGVWLPDRDTHFNGCLSNPKKKGDWGLYQPHIYRMAIKSVDANSRRVALDIGAHVGLLSMQMAKDFTGVVAFEPWDDNAECFDKNVEDPNVQRLRLSG